MEKSLRFVGTVIFTLTLFIQTSGAFASMPILDRYFTRTNGDYFTPTLWSMISHAGASCSCFPDDNGMCEIIIPSNSAVYIRHNVTATCNITISNNALLVIDNGGSLNISGNSSLTGTGDLQINQGGTLNITGDFNLNGDGTGINNGTINVYGDLTFSGNGSLCGTGVVNVGGATIGGSPCSTIILPVDLLSFTASIRDKLVEVSWITASESNSDYFIVERSENGIDYTELSRISSAGNSQYVIQYSFTDDDPVSGVSYYRLIQRDVNGMQKKYDPVAVLYTMENEFTVFPNPLIAGQSACIGVSDIDCDEVIITMVDISGRIIFNEPVPVKDGIAFFTVPVDENTMSGTYFITASFNNKILRSKILIGN
jgi:hypothetical protein